MRACENGPRIPDETWVVVDAWLGDLWSPEQITGRLDERGLPSVSHEAIYHRIYAEKRNGGTLHRALRCQKARRKRYGGRERRGDWEADLVIGAGHHQALVTINERKSRYALI